ncbi:MAG: hypothetical protein FGM24_11345 [Candidatus Kapabacteria bacterium]|nr:hypothetical protein [Candidatus Kapabacteria bacterium]
MMVVLATLCMPALAQDPTKDKLRLAATYERTGDMRSAARIYLEVLEARASDIAAYEGVVRTLTALGQFTSLLPIVQQHDERVATAESSIRLAEVLWKLGRQDDAGTAWDNAADRAGGDADAWAEVAASQAGSVANARAAASFRKARSLGDDEGAYASQLCALYIALGYLEQGAAEALKDYDASGELLRAQGRMGAIMASAKGRTILRDLLLTDDETPSIERSRLRQWYFREMRDWPTALSITIDIDKRTKALGQEALNFGDAARKEGAYDVALQAYEYVLSIAPNEQRRLTAIYSYARTLDVKFRSGKAFDRDDAQRIIDRYAAIVRDYPTNWYASNALYQMALLELDVLKNIDAGRDHLQRLTNQFAGSPAAAEGAIRLAQLYIGLEKFDIADQMLRTLQRTTSSETQPQRDLAMVIRGDLAAWRDRLDSAQMLYAEVAAKPGSTAANDALDRLLLLQLAEQDSVAVAELRSADKLRATNKPDLAAQAYVRAAANARDAELRDRCRFAAAEQYVAMNQDSAALPILESLLVDIPDSIFGDRALWLKADIAVRRKDTSAAIDALTILLVQYPRSILLPDARERLRSLRGDTQ